MSLTTPRVESFVVRFIHDTPKDGASVVARGWRGTVVHIQTNAEKSFTNIADAVAFIPRYVDIGDFVLPSTCSPREGGEE